MVTHVGDCENSALSGRVDIWEYQNITTFSSWTIIWMESLVSGITEAWLVHYQTKTYWIMVISPAVVVSYHRNRGITKTSFISKDNFWNSCHTDNVSTPHFKHSTFSLGWEARTFNNNHCAWFMMRQFQFFGSFSKNLKKMANKKYFFKNVSLYCLE